MTIVSTFERYNEYASIDRKAEEERKKAEAKAADLHPKTQHGCESAAFSAYEKASQKWDAFYF